jgi:hypothetical protein
MVIDMLDEHIIRGSYNCLCQAKRGAFDHVKGARYDIVTEK